MKLLNLPYLPLFQILRFLDEKSLVKMQLSCRALNCIIDRDRRRLAFRPIGRFRLLKIQPKKTSACGMLTYFVEVKQYNEKRPTVYGASDDKSDPFNRTFNEWINQFSYVEIRELCLKDTHFEEKAMDRLQNLLSFNKLRAETLWIQCCELPNNDISCLTNFVAQMKLKGLIIWDIGSKIPNRLLKKTFVETMPSLDALEYIYSNFQKDKYGAMELTAFPIFTKKVPSDFRISCAFYLNFLHFKRLIHDWYNDGEITIDCWIVSLIGLGEIVEMGQKLGLPFSVNRRDGFIVITRRFSGSNRKIVIVNTRRNNKMSGADEWTICGKHPKYLYLSWNLGVDLGAFPFFSK